MDQDSWATNLRNVSSLTDKIYILKNLKNSIIGNPLKKESVIAQGGLDLITQCIRKELGCSQNGRSVDQEFSTEHLNEEEFCRYQGLQIIASIAQGLLKYTIDITKISLIDRQKHLVFLLPSPLLAYFQRFFLISALKITHLSWF